MPILFTSSTSSDPEFKTQKLQIMFKINYILAEPNTVAIFRIRSSESRIPFQPPQSRSKNNNPCWVINRGNTVME